MSLFQEHTQEEMANSIADYLPNGPLFLSKKLSGTKLRSLLIGLAQQIMIAENKLELTWQELDPSTTTLLIEEWESAVGIPDECFDQFGTLADRRRNVLVKLNSSIQTEQDFIDLAALFGFTIQISIGSEVSTFPMTFPFPLFSSEKEIRFTLIIDFNVPSSSSFPFTFPFVFEDGGVAEVKCLFEKLKPANVNIIYREIT
jgi:uncharacterized protein YmfQ (DUF2313 family)